MFVCYIVSTKEIWKVTENSNVISWAYAFQTEKVKMSWPKKYFKETIGVCYPFLSVEFMTTLSTTFFGQNNATHDGIIWPLLSTLK